MFPAPGWFVGAEIQVLKPHLLAQMGNTVLNRAGGGPPRTVEIGSAPLDWTVSPRVFLGYRLPSGFGEFMVSYRYLGTVGSQKFANGSTALDSRLAFNMIDFDYGSRELSLWPQWDMKWIFGMRVMTLFFDSRTAQAIPVKGGGGDFYLAGFNNLFGIGPHTALEMARHIGDSGWSFYVRGDIADLWTDTESGLGDKTFGPTGQPLPGQTRAFGHQGTTILNMRTGATWQPSPSSGMRLFLGYQYEYFWALNRVNPSGPFTFSHGQLWDQGVVMQATFNY
jgi:hypothetical protein